MVDTWAVVLQRHLDTLPPAAQQNLRDATDAQSCLKIIRLAQGRRKGYDRLLLALQGLIDPIKRFEDVIDVVVQVNSGIATPIWGPLRLVFGLASERLATLQNIAILLERLTEPLIRFKTYETLFHSNPGVHRSICNLYTHFLTFCAVILRYHGRSSIRNVLSSFDKEFREASDAIRHCWTEVDIAANAASMEAAKRARDADASRRAVQMRADVLRWLSPSNVQDDLRQQASMCMSGSCEWLLENPTYKAFAQPGESRVLTVLGRPGEGKTFLATFAVETLLRAHTNEVLYFFCKAGDPEKRRTLQVLRTILAQLLRAGLELSRVLEEIYYNNGNAVAQSLVDVITALEHALRATQSSDIYVIVDGVDECEDSVDLIQSLLELASSIGTTQKAVHLMFCGRPNDAALEELKGHGVRLWLSATDRTSGIRAYAWQRVSKMPVLSCDKDQEAVVNEVCEAAEGLWLYARLMLNEIQHLPNLAMIQHQLQNIPRGLQELYTQILTTLASTLSEWELRVAQQLFLWIDVNDFARVGRWTSLSMDALEKTFEQVSMGGPIHDPTLLVRKIGSNMVDCFTEDNGFPVVDFIHHTARQFVHRSSTAPYHRIPTILQPRRLRQMHCGATAAWYLSQHPQAKAERDTLRQTNGLIGFNLYFEMAYALWGAFHTAEISAVLDEEEAVQLSELCQQLTQFLSTDQCLTWVEMAILINYAGGFPQLLENVDDAIDASRTSSEQAHPTFKTFQSAKLDFFQDFAYVIRKTGPKECSSTLREGPSGSEAPAGFQERTLAQKLLQMGHKYAYLSGDLASEKMLPIREVPEAVQTSEE